jgi:SET domain-containing protein
MSAIYPSELCVDDTLPTTDRFTVCSVNGKVGMGVRSKLRFIRGTLVAKFTGHLSNTILQHTLQASPHTHLHDPYFVGLLTHSCAPNCALDMQRLEILALTDVEADQLLTIDYAATEDVLHRQFACGCGSPACRKWITGRREPVNEAGHAYLAGLASKKVRSLIGRVRRSAR